MIGVPLALYVHLPWCVRKCPYCDFNSHTAGDAPPRDRYVDALCRDIALEARRALARPLQSVFLGGGTPSLFSGGEIGRVLDCVREHFQLAADAEITMEANPGTLERHDLGGYRRAGVNRLSLGAQSFDAAMLAALGRIHGPAEISAAVAAARAAGFDNLNLDLMFALPGQDLAMAGADLAAALELEPEHLSLYQLTLEPNTVFYRQPPAAIPDDELAWEMQEQAFERLAAAGFARYEISAFSRPGAACRHNLNYWTFGDYLAVGAGAHGKVTDERGRVCRYHMPLHPRAYMDQALAATVAEVPGHYPDAAELVFEFMLNALRLPQGFSEQCFEDRTGLSMGELRPRLTELAGQGLLEGTDARWRPTALGLRFLNDLQAAFLPPTTAISQGAIA